MKYLSDYTEQGITDLLNNYGGFFAFSDEQFNEKKKEGVEYVSCGHGLICPKENAKALMTGLIQNGDSAVNQDILENGKDNIIRRELYNHEAFYTGEIEDTCDALKMYGITQEEVWKVYLSERRKSQD
jgi:hypothetical protein